MSTQKSSNDERCERTASEPLGAAIDLQSHVVGAYAPTTLMALS